MKKCILPLVLFAISTSFMNAQKKSDLIAEIDQLKSKIDSTSSLLAESRRNERVSKTEAENMKSQMEQVQETNASLMKNMNNLTQLSQRNSENVDSALKNLKVKEAQLKSITNSISSNDSIAVYTLTSVKQTMGDGPEVAVAEGSIVISEKQENLFSDKGVLTDAGKAFLKKVVDIITANSSSTLTIESLGASADKKTAAFWSATIAALLQDEYKINPSLIKISFAEAGFFDEIRFKLQPNYNQFYLKVRESMK